MPADFDRRHFNAASAGLVARGYLRGDEPVYLTGMSAAGPLAFTLPSVPSPQVEVGLRRGSTAQVPLALDTIIIEPDERRVILFWRGHLSLKTGPHEVLEVRARASTR